MRPINCNYFCIEGESPVFCNPYEGVVHQRCYGTIKISAQL
jgi:hypothetical protein